VTRRFRLASVLRARQVQEDAARGAVIRARADVETARAETRRRDSALSARNNPMAGSATAFVAALCARQGLAAEISAAASLAAQAAHVVDERLGEFTDASVRRRTVEKLAERHEAASRAAEDAAEQRAIDDLAKPMRPALGGAVTSAPDAPEVQP
jgi:flagellar export protein FliJ